MAHEAAHDALSDVRATIALARLVRERQPKLFYLLLLTITGGLRAPDFMQPLRASHLAPAAGHGSDDGGVS